MTDYTKLSDEELKIQFEILWARYMYYQAAEGNWNQETEARGRATKQYWECLAECKERGFEVY